MTAREWPENELASPKKRHVNLHVSVPKRMESKEMTSADALAAAANLPRTEGWQPAVHRERGSGE